MQTQIVEALKNNGLIANGEIDGEELATQLGKLDVSGLWTIVESLIGEEELVGIDGNEQVQSMVLSYALINAFENDLEQIGQSEIDAAIQKVSETVDKLSGSTNEVSYEPQNENTLSAESKVTRKILVTNLVEENPDALADEIVDMIVDIEPGINMQTARQYYYNARKELGLNPVGKRGRRPSDTMERIKALLNGNLDAPKSEMVKKIVDEIGVTEGTASTYYSKAKKQLKL